MSAVRCPLTMKTTTFSIKDLRKHFRIYLPYVLSAQQRYIFSWNRQHSFRGIDLQINKIQTSDKELQRLNRINQDTPVSPLYPFCS